MSRSLPYYASRVVFFTLVATLFGWLVDRESRLIKIYLVAFIVFFFISLIFSQLGCFGWTTKYYENKFTGELNPYFVGCGAYAPWYVKEVNFLEEVVIRDDPTLCEKMTYKAKCYFHLANSTKNPSYCEKITEKNVLTISSWYRTYREYGVSLRSKCYASTTNPQDAPDYCNKFDSINEREICYFEYAGHLLDTGFCEHIRTKAEKKQSPSQESCIGWVETLDKRSQ